MGKFEDYLFIIFFSQLMYFFPLVRMGKFEDYLFIICLFQLMYYTLVWSLFSSNFYLTYFITQMTSEEEQNFGKPSSGCGSNLVTCSTSTTDGTNLYKKRRLTSIVWNDHNRWKRFFNL